MAPLSDFGVWIPRTSSKDRMEDHLWAMPFSTPLKDWVGLSWKSLQVSNKQLEPHFKSFSVTARGLSHF